MTGCCKSSRKQVSPPGCVPATFAWWIPLWLPPLPARPQKARNILLAFLVGLVGGVGLALFREYLDNTVKSPDDIESLTGLPSLAVVPSLPGLNATHGRFSRLAREAAPQSATGPRVELLSYIQPKSQISEAFRALRTSLLLSQADHPPQVILVTSALPREGKTTAAVNLAVTLAQLGDRTLLMDSDLRKPGIRRALNLTIGKEVGLSSYLAGVSTLDEVTIPHPTINNLVALTTGPVPPSPADLLSSHRMREAIVELRHRFKFIVIDSPPVMAATDPVILSALTDGVLLVVRSGETPKEAFTRTRDLLAAVKCRLLGVVLNAVDSSAPDYYYSYRYYPYAYGYGYGEDAGKSVPDFHPGPKILTGHPHRGAIMRCLITGGAGFIGSHLSEALLAQGEEVFILDDLSTGSVENIRHLKTNNRFHYVFDSIMNKHLLAEMVDESDVIFHLAAAVGVRLIVESPVRTIATNVHGTQNVLDAASKKKKLVFTASTSEVYGKSDKVPFHEDADLVLGPTTKGRWSYAASKALDEFLALSYWKEKKLPVIIARFFNTVGPRQTGRYGMVLPNFVRQALADEPITVYGTGQQSRCFCDVRDCVQAVLRLDRQRKSDRRSRQHRQHAGSHHPGTRASREAAHQEQFADYARALRSSLRTRLRRHAPPRPSARKTRGPHWIPSGYSLDDIVDGVVAYFREKQESGMAKTVTAAGAAGRTAAGLSAD